MSTPRSFVSTALWTSALLVATGSCGDDPPAEERCAAVATGTTFTMPQADGDRSFQAHATFDGEAIWVTYTTALAADESLRIHASRVACDGTVSVEGIRIEDQSGGQTESRITSYDGRVMLAWQRDDQVSNFNLSTHYKVFDRDDDPATVPSRKLETEHLGAPAGNTWMPELNASKAGFVLAGLRGIEPHPAFQAFAQRFDSDGALVGEAINAQLSDELYQDSVTASMDDDGSLILGWTRENDNELEHAVHVRVEAGSNTPANDPIRVCEGACSQVSLGGREDRGQYLAVAMPDGTLGIKPSTLFNVEAPLLSVGRAGATPIYPTIAVGPETGAVAWLQQITGFSAEIHIQAFSGDGYDMVTVGEELVVATENPAVAPYRLSFIHIQDDIYMLTWSEGPTSSLKVKWRFVDLAQ